MQVYNKQPIDVLWEMFKSFYKKEKIQVFKEIMHEEEDKTPDNYVLLRSQITDVVKTYGDGIGRTRTSDCDVIIISKGYASNSTDLHNIIKNKVRNILKENEVNWQEFNLGFDTTIKSTQHNFSFEVNYIG